jgi:quercetin dioxygenase-like cupin family protein
MYIVKSEFEVDLDDHGVYRLLEGDTLYYSGGVRHRWRAVADSDLRLLLVQQGVPD